MSSGKGNGRTWAAISLALAAVMAIAGVAIAGKRLKTSSETTTVGPDANGSAEARCERGTKAVSGGFETEFDSEPGGPFLEVRESRKAGRRGWTGSASNGGTEAGDLTSYAYCRKQKLETVSEVATLSPTDFETLTPRCPGGTKVFAGGYAADPIIPGGGDTPVIAISKSRKLDKRTWEVSAAANGTAEGDVTAYAYCREGKRLKSKQSSATVSDDNPSEQIEARCKRRQRVVSGGFSSTGDTEQTVARVLTSMKQGRRTWSLNAILSGTGLPADVTGYAYCEKKKPK